MSIAPTSTDQDWQHRVAAFLRTELAPTPARWRATARIAAAFAVSLILLMALHVPDGEFLIVSLFVVSQGDAWASVTKAVLRLLGTLGGGLLGLFAVIALVDKPWILLPYQALIVGAALFFTRTTTTPYAFLLAGMTYLIAVMPTSLSTAEATLVQVLWRVFLTTIGALIGTLAQLLLWPDDPEQVLLDDLATRLQLADHLIERTVAPSALTATAPVPDLLTATGIARQLDLVTNAESQSRWLRRRHAEQQVLVTNVELLVVAALRLEQIRVAHGGTVTLSDRARDRLQRIRQATIQLQQSLRGRRTPDMAASQITPPFGPDAVTPLVVLSSISEMERALERIPATLVFLEDGGLEPLTAHASGMLEPAPRQSIFTPACTLQNTDAVLFALKGALGATIADLIYNGLQWPGIATCVLTCLVVAQSCFGAGVQKSILRLAGVLIGGAATAITIIILMPNMEQVTSLLVVTTFWFGCTAWIVAGSSRISYAGLQIAIVMALCLVNSLRPTINLEIAGDRLVGVLVGIIVMSCLDITVWPVFAGSTIRSTVARVLTEMAQYWRFASGRQIGQARDRSFAVFRDLANALTLQDAMRIESQLGAVSDTEPDRVLRLLNRTQQLFLSLLATARHRIASQFDQAVPAAESRLAAIDEAIARHLERMVPMAEGRALVDAGAIDAALTQLADMVVVDDQLAQDARSQARLRAHVDLYRELLSAMRHLADAATEAVEPAPPPPVMQTPLTADRVPSRH